MGPATFDLFKPHFWCVLAVAVLVLVPLTSPRLHKWAWAAINLAYLGLMLGLPDLPRAAHFLQRNDVREAASLVASSGFVIACSGLLAAWLALKAVQHRRRGVLALVVAGTALVGLFLIHKLPRETLHDSERLRELLSAINLPIGKVLSLKLVLAGLGFSYVALRLVEALRLTYEGRYPAPDLPSTINYLVPFHMPAAGPILAYADYMAQPAVPPPPSASAALRGAERIAHGMFKKYVLAMAVKEMTYTWTPLPFPYSIADMLLFYLWLYLDFSSYTDITVGAGTLVGLTTPENFNRPYVARNLIDFWDRWHMSLSRFIYRNVFVPVQLALLRRTGPERALWCGTVAFTVSFLLCGLWHELNLPWLAWGAMHAVGLVVVNTYRAFLQRWLGREGMSRYRANRAIRVLMIVVTQLYVAASMAVANWP